MTSATSPPVSLGAQRFAAVATPFFSAHVLRFGAHVALPRHDHAHSTFVVAVAGRIEQSTARATRECAPGIVLTEPAGEQHSNRTGSEGATIVTLQDVSLAADAPASVRRVFDRRTTVRLPRVTAIAGHLAAALCAADQLTPLAVDTLGLEMIQLVAPDAELRHERDRPRWLDRTMECVHEARDSRFSLALIAAHAEMNPAYLARAFRRHVGKSLARYARDVRLEAAMLSLRLGDAPIAQIAVEAGFVDQSHFTRAFKMLTGLTPAAYRAH